MGTLVFQATAGGSFNFVGPNIAGTVSLTLPSADGTSGQFLKTDGAGTLSFAAATASAATPTVLGTVYAKQTTSGGTPFLTAFGYNAGLATTGINNTFMGVSAGTANTSGTGNTGLGFNALAAMITGSNNIAIGSGALASATAVSSSVAIGLNALNLSNVNSGSVAIGLNSQALLTASAQNVSVGQSTLAVATSGTGQTAIGSSVLAASTTGASNTGVGRNALILLTSGSSNTSIGRDTMPSLTTGVNNTVVGVSAGGSLVTTTIAATSLVNGTSYQIVTMGTTTAAQWIASGAVAGTVGETFTANATPGVGTGTVATTANIATQCLNNTFIGVGSGSSITTGSKNTVLGNYSGSAAPISTTGSNYVVLSDGDGNIVASTKTAQTFALSGGTLSTGTGIAFPATQSASSNANTLDDYEEGTFTPTLNFGGASVGITYAYQYGAYTKVGNRVVFDVCVSVSSKGSSTGNMRTAGLPFAAIVDGAVSRTAVSFSTQTALGGSLAAGQISGGDSHFQIETAAGGTFTNLTDTNAANNTSYWASAEYRTAT